MYETIQNCGETRKHACKVRGMPVCFLLQAQFMHAIKGKELTRRKRMDEV
jgi:hypothetical protein